MNKVKKSARKPRSLSSVAQEESDSRTHSEDLQARNEHEDTTTSSQPLSSYPTHANPEVTFTMPTSVPLTDDFFQNFIPLLSPTATTTPITIAPCPNVSVEILQPHINITQSTPLFSESTATTKTMTNTPTVTVNVSDMGAGASGVIVSPISPPISPL